MSGQVEQVFGGVVVMVGDRISISFVPHLHFIYHSPTTIPSHIYWPVIPPDRYLQYSPSVTAIHLPIAPSHHCSTLYNVVFLSAFEHLFAFVGCCCVHCYIYIFSSSCCWVGILHLLHHIYPHLRHLMEQVMVERLDETMVGKQILFDYHTLHFYIFPSLVLWPPVCSLFILPLHIALSLLLLTSFTFHVLISLF